MSLASLSFALVTTLAGFTSTGVQTMIGPDGPAAFGGTRLFFTETLPNNPLRAALFAIDAPLSLGADLILLPASLPNEVVHLLEGKTVRLSAEAWAPG
ncbi:MAG: hypothetical protein JKY65_21025 [Planctomycetes bacterium]|nr:hypothetical protein [Planctomycetota bacterium]